eukprot:6193779-Pleurochrysis_carterae.AAC.3
MRTRSSRSQYRLSPLAGERGTQWCTRTNQGFRGTRLIAASSRLFPTAFATICSPEVLPRSEASVSVAAVC